MYQHNIYRYSVTKLVIQKCSVFVIKYVYITVLLLVNSTSGPYSAPSARCMSPWTGRNYCGMKIEFCKGFVWNNITAKVINYLKRSPYTCHLSTSITATVAYSAADKKSVWTNTSSHCRSPGIIFSPVHSSSNLSYMLENSACFLESKTTHDQIEIL